MDCCSACSCGEKGLNFTVRTGLIHMQSGPTAELPSCRITARIPIGSSPAGLTLNAHYHHAVLRHLTNMEEGNQQQLATDNQGAQVQSDSHHQPLTSNDATVSDDGNGTSDLSASTTTESQASSVPNADAAADLHPEEPLESVVPNGSGQSVSGNVTESPAPAPAPTPMTASASIGLLTNGLNRLSSHEMDLAELKVKIICQEKNNQALKMELKCAELQVAAKEKLDVKKTRLIELLDAKLSAVEKKNVRLMEMMEQVLRDKDTHTHRLMDATKNMEDLSKRLAESEKARGDMRNINRELKTMLDNMEGKGTQIARLAKEKVLKYKSENERIQRELDDLKSDDVSAAADTVTTGGDVNLEPHGQAEQLCHQLNAVIFAKNWQEESVETLRAVLAEVGPLAVDLRRALEQPLPREVIIAAADSDLAVAALEKQYKDDIEAKEREIATLKDELNRLKSAIGQLVGLNMGALTAAATT